MKILVTCLGSYGDVYPMVGLALRLKQRGHRVTLLTNPFFDNLAVKYGLDSAPFGSTGQYQRFVRHPDLFDPRRSVSAIFETLITPSIRPAYDRLAECAGREGAILVSSMLVIAARLIQEKLHLPNATLHLTPMAFKSAHEMPHNAVVPFPDWLPLALRRLYWWVADRLVTDRLIVPELNELRAELGLPPTNRVLTRWGHSPQMVIGLFPGWYGAPQPDWPANSHLTGFPLFDEDQDTELPAPARDFLDDGSPPIIFMPGSLMQQADVILRTAVEACQALGRRAILLSRFPAQIPSPLPDTIRHFHYLPLARLLPRADALVHHGGIGTCAQALRAGVPQLIHPMAYDQHDNAWRLKRLGVGEWILPRAWRALGVACTLENLTTAEPVRARCRAIAEWFPAGDPLLETCQWIESMG